MSAIPAPARSAWRPSATSRSAPGDRGRLDLAHGPPPTCRSLYARRRGDHAIDEARAAPSPSSSRRVHGEHKAERAAGRDLAAEAAVQRRHGLGVARPAGLGLFDRGRGGGGRQAPRRARGGVDRPRPRRGHGVGEMPYRATGVEDALVGTDCNNAVAAAIGALDDDPDAASNVMPTASTGPTRRSTCGGPSSRQSHRMSPQRAVSRRSRWSRSTAVRPRHPRYVCDARWRPRDLPRHQWAYSSWRTGNVEKTGWPDPGRCACARLSASTTRARRLDRRRRTSTPDARIGSSGAWREPRGGSATSLAGFLVGGRIAAHEAQARTAAAHRRGRAAERRVSRPTSSSCRRLRDHSPRSAYPRRAAAMVVLRLRTRSATRLQLVPLPAGSFTPVPVADIDACRYQVDALARSWPSSIGSAPPTWRPAGVAEPSAWPRLAALAQPPRRQWSETHSSSLRVKRGLFFGGPRPPPGSQPGAGRGQVCGTASALPVQQSQLTRKPHPPGCQRHQYQQS